MKTLRVECLQCGCPYELVSAGAHVLDGECPRCRYVGWAASAELTETARRSLRERPVEQRRLRLVA